MEHPYEYALMVDFFPVVSLGGIPDYAKPEDQKELMRVLGKFAAQDLPKAMTTFPGAVGDGWEVNSHSITFSGTTAIFSVLLQRRRK